MSTIATFPAVLSRHRIQLTHEKSIGSEHDYFVTSAIKTPKGSSVTSLPFEVPVADDCGVATRLFRLAEAKPLSARLKVAFWGEDDIFSATNTAFPL